MILVLAGRDDRGARSLAERWSSHGAALLLPADLSEPGWRYVPGHHGAGTAVVGGRRVQANQIEGVVMRLGFIEEEELVCVSSEERSYAATEMTAFLASWLNELPCPVLNRPTASFLSGPGWSTDEWALKARQAGIPVAPSSIRLRPPGWPDAQGGDATPGSGETSSQETASTSVTVVGSRSIGDANELQRAQAMCLARLAGVECLVVRFGGPDVGGAFASADPWPDVTDPDVADALLQRFSCNESSPAMVSVG